MTEKQRNNFYTECHNVIIESAGYANSTSVIEFACRITVWGKDGLPFLRMIEQDLYDKGFVDSKIECWEDFLKSRTRFIFVRQIQYYIAFVIKWCNNN